MRTPGLGAGRLFTTTHWSVVLAAGHDSSPGSQEALEKLCRTYWYPLYAYVRQRGHEPHDAQDLTQDFFYRLLDKRYLAQVDQNKGKFRSFLMVAINHFLANERDRANAAKRGGRVRFVAVDGASAEQRYSLEPVTDVSPEKIFERRWALSVLDRVLAHLRDEFTQAGKAQQFESLKIFLTGEKPSVTYAELAARLQTTEAALKMAVKPDSGGWRAAIPAPPGGMLVACLGRSGSSRTRSCVKPKRSSKALNDFPGCRFNPLTI